MEQDRKEETITIHDFVSYYRRLRSEKFSDSRVIYEVPLTRELFERQLELLSTKKMQSAFENFVVRCAERLITPNIKPQTGPDGGGDGKVDAETYEVSPDISDKWHVAEAGAAGKEKWAFAISCKKQWKPKVRGDIEKIAGTGRGYTRALFFSNQFIKSSTRADMEKKLTEQYGLEVSIFDGLWCSDAVFVHGCKEAALECLHFSDEYKKKQDIVGPLDTQRLKRLAEAEEEILRPVEGLDTAYIETLLETCLLSRGLERPRVETEGRFGRAIRECRQHGTVQQRFNIVYNHAWTSFFWFEDVGATYRDYLTLKDFVAQDCTVTRIEKLTNILTNLTNAARVGLFDIGKVQAEADGIKELAHTLEQRSDKPSCLLFVRLYIAEQRLIGHLIAHEPIDDDIDAIRPLLLEAPSHLEISFEAQCTIITRLNKVIDDNPKYEDLVDDLMQVLKKARSEQAAAQIEMERGIALMDKRKYKQAIRHFGFCIQPFEKEEYQKELIQVSGMMGMALYETGLPYSAETYLVKAAALLLKDYYASGNIPHLLLTILQQLCEIELMLGRIVMYLNWYELMTVISGNGDFAEDTRFNEKNRLYDSAWACRLAAADLNGAHIAVLPDILDRMGMPASADYLKFALGYADEINKEAKKIFSEDGWRDKMIGQPIFDQFFCDLNIAGAGKAELQTTANNCTIRISFENSCLNQMVAEMFLGVIESLMATMDRFEVLPVTPEIHIEIVTTENTYEFRPSRKSNEYQLCIGTEYRNKELWTCISGFIACFFSRNAVSAENIENILQSKQNGEKLMDRIGDLLRAKQAVCHVLGNEFKHKIEDWEKETDRNYTLRNTNFTYSPRHYRNVKQQNLSLYGINADINSWDEAGWSGCGFAFDEQGTIPPIFGLAFKDVTRGKELVEEWRRKIVRGERAITIYIVRGIDRQHPAWYRVCLSPDIQPEQLPEKEYFINVCRKHTMTPDNTQNLDAFEKKFKASGICLLAALPFDCDRQAIMLNDLGNAFYFSNIRFRNAWEISPQDMAGEALEPDDDPYIPETEKNNAPILKVLEAIRKPLKNPPL